VTMRNPERLTARQVADLLGVSESNVRSLHARHGLGYRPGPPGVAGTYSGRKVHAMKARREAHEAPGRLTRRQAADLLGVSIDRLNQLVRAEHDQLGRREHARGRVSLSEARVRALALRRARAPRYPLAGSTWPEGMKKP
jgi:DNA-binding transcriptional regulator YdaS (Cro superfamily)